MTVGAAVICLKGIMVREILRFLYQRERFLAALVRPLVWLLIFAAGFRAALDIAVMPPYETPITYEMYIVPGLLGMIQLFNGMQSSLSMVYDREMGSMKILLVAPLPRWYLLTCKLLAGTAVSILQVYTFVLIAGLFGTHFPAFGYVTMFPALIVSGLMLGAIGLFLSSAVRQLENFAGIMNFVIFPMFFLSSALYPISQIAESNALLAVICRINPFTYAVELVRFSLYLRLNMEALTYTAVGLFVFLTLAIAGYSPAKGLMPRKTGGE
jgi:ABC-2 type transport system permease protein